MQSAQPLALNYAEDYPSSMKSVDALIAHWPSMAELGRDLGLPYSTVAAWKQRGSIPVTYWRKLVNAARQHGFDEITSELLIDLHDHAPGAQADDFAEDPQQIDAKRHEKREADDGSRQFSRWKPLRRAHFATSEEIADHVRGLRDEWDRR